MIRFVETGSPPKPAAKTATPELGPIVGLGETTALETPVPARATKPMARKRGRAA